MKLRSHKKYIRWRTKIFKKHHYKCFLCGDNNGGNLNAHHILPFSFIIHKNEIMNVKDALVCKELWDLNNGVCVCNECHKIADQAAKILAAIGD
jgi:5-methylcytosine-specific restriction endonuclease McrA